MIIIGSLLLRVFVDNHSKFHQLTQITFYNVNVNNIKIEELEMSMSKVNFVEFDTVKITKTFFGSSRM